MSSTMRCPGLDLHSRRASVARRPRSYGAQHRRRAAVCSTSTRLGTATTFSSLSQLVSESLEAGAGHPFVGIKSLVDPAVAFDGPLVQLRGEEAYLQNATFWFERQQSWLPEAKCKVLRVSQVAPSQVLVRWRLTWIRPGSYNLVKLGRALPGVEVRFKDLLDKYDQEVKVTWKAVFKLFKRVVQERVLEVSIAAIEGTTTFDFKEVQPDATYLSTSPSPSSTSTSTSTATTNPSLISEANQPSTISSSSPQSSPTTQSTTAPPATTPSSTSSVIQPPGSLDPLQSTATSKTSQADSAFVDKLGSTSLDTPGATSAATSSTIPDSVSPSSSTASPSPSSPTPTSQSTPTPQPTYVLSKSTEFIDLLPLLLSKKVKNRLVAKDLLLMLYIRQPLGWSFEEWFQHVGEQVDVTDVPGIGGFDVDGLSTEEKAERFEDATVALALGTFATLLVAFVFGWKYMSRWMF